MCGGDYIKVYNCILYLQRVKRIYFVNFPLVMRVFMPSRRF